MDTQEIFATFFLVLVALFLQELARRVTQRVSSISELEHPVTYFDFVRIMTLYPRFRKQDTYSQVMLSICAYTLIQAIFYVPWAAAVWLYTASIPKVPIPEPDLSNFLFLILQLWIMFFIAVSVFLPYWLFGLYSFLKFEPIASSDTVPYSGRFSTDEIKYHKYHYWIRVLSWWFLSGVSLVVYGITFLIPY